MTALIITTPLAAAGEFEEAVLKGSRYVQDKDFKNAILEYKKAVKLKPSNPKALLLLGLTYANAGDFDKAIEYTEKAAAREPSYTVYHNLGLIYANRRDYNKGVENYKKALDINPASFRDWYQLGLLEASQNNFEEAIRCYYKALEHNPYFADAHLGLGSAYHWLGDKEKSKEQVQKLKTLDRIKAQALEEWLAVKESSPATPTPS